MRFNAHHAPLGAYATFTLGIHGRGGGLALEAGMPPNQDVLIGAQAADGTYEALPFSGEGAVRLLAATREFGPTVDTWEAEGIRLRILSPLRPVPEPGAAADRELRDALLPAVLAQLTVDNTAAATARRVFFGIHAETPEHAGSPWGPTPRLTRARAGDAAFVLEDGRGRAAGVFAPGAQAAAGPDVLAALESPSVATGEAAVLSWEVPPGACRAQPIAIVFWHGGEVAAGPGVSCAYWYTRLFGGLEDVAAYALEHFDRLAREHAAAGALLDGLPVHRRFQLAHAIRSYSGNTALLAAGDRPLWAVVEGEFMFVNTLDLTVDQVFFELRQSPWTVRNVLDRFLERHAYEDRCGVTFTHDMGSFPTLAAPGTSAYEGRTHMAGEQVTNWTLAALAYVAQTGDEAWAAARAAALERCLRSLLARAPDGVPADTGVGEEITTFDSLDASLRRACGSSYLAGKQWAACAGLSAFFAARGRPDLAEAAHAQAERAADRLVAAAEARGALPALLDGESDAHVIPAVEGLAFALFAGAIEPDGAFLRVLRRHLEALHRFPDGGWKLTSTHDNSWLSKLYLAQFVARRILGLPADDPADAAHAGWLMDPEGAAWAWSDQILAGRIHSSRYYPRGVTAALWLEEDRRTARLRPPP